MSPGSEFGLGLVLLLVLGWTWVLAGRLQASEREIAHLRSDAARLRVLLRQVAQGDKLQDVLVNELYE